MTSAPSRQRLLNGSSLWLLALAFLISCGSTQPVVVTAPPKEDNEEKARLQAEQDSAQARLIRARKAEAKRNKTYKVAIFLPIFKGDQSYLNATEKKLSEIALDFWWGSKLALDSLAGCGLKLKVQLLDTRNDTAVTRRGLNSLNKLKPDLIIGPLFSKNLEVVSPWSAKHEVRLISPMSSIDSCAFVSPYAFFSNPSRLSEAQSAARLVNNMSFADFPIFSINGPSAEDRESSNAFKAALDTAQHKRFKEINASSNFIEKHSLDQTLADSNIVFVSSRSELFVSSVLAELTRTLKHCIVIGNQQWFRFRSMDAKNWESLNMHFVANCFIDYSREDVKGFVRAYRNKYSDEPSEYAIRGFDEAMLYAGAWLQKGRRYELQLGANPYTPLHNDYRLMPREGCEGLQNEKLYILKLQELNLIKLY